jgi:hypothetical protein
MRLVISLTLAVASGVVGLVAEAMFSNRVASYHPDLLVISALVVFFISTGDLPGKLFAPRRDKTTEQISSTPWHRFERETETHVAEEKAETVRFEYGSIPVQRVRLRSKLTDNIDAEVVAIKLYDRSFWDFESDERLIVGRRRPIKLNQELDSKRIRELFSRVEHIICLGLVSSAEKPEQNGENLSLARARQLEDWVRFSPVMVDQHAKVHAVPLGRGLSKHVKDKPEEKDQRAAVLIGLRSDNPLVPLPILLDQVIPYINTEIVRLDDYSRSIASQLSRPLAEIAP